MTLRRHWPGVLLVIFSIFSLSVFAIMALAIWFGPGAQPVPTEISQSVVQDKPLSDEDGTSLVLAAVGLGGVETSDKNNAGQAVFHRTGGSSLSEVDWKQANSTTDTTDPAEVATAVKAEAVAIADDLSGMVLRGSTGALPALAVIPVSPPASPSPLPTESQIIPAPVIDTAFTAHLPAQSSEPQINGLPLSAFLIMPEEVRAYARSIIARGKMLGRDPGAYSKVGDSTIENPNFMTRFDEGPYDLGEFGYLEAVIRYFSGSHSRQGVAVRQGMHSWSVNDPFWADSQLCNPNETPLACEIRLNNPSIIFIRLGSNDSGTPAGFEKNLRQVVEFAIERGVLPILGTKADRFEGSDINNQIIRRVATETQVPLWDFDRVARTLPDSGLKTDGVHLTVYYAHDYTSPTAYQRGHGLHNLSALLVLDTVWRELFTAGE